MLKIVIFGGSGFIGSHLAQSFRSNVNLTIVSQSPIKSKILNCNYKVFQYSQKNIYEFISQNQFDIIHLLSGNPHPSNSYMDPSIDIKLTINPTLSILEVLRKISFKGILWLSSSVAVYGSCFDKYLSEDSDCYPLSNYAVAKLSIENYAKLYAKNYNLKIGIYRLFSTYGPGLKRQVIYDNICKMRDGLPNIFLVSSMESARDFSYVKDQAMAIKFLSDNIEPSGDIYNLGSGESTKIIDLVKIIAEFMNYKGKISCLQDTKNTHDVSWTANINKITALGFKQSYSLREGIKETLSYIES